MGTASHQRFCTRPPWRLPLSSKLIDLALTKGWKPPQEGWTADTFKRNGARLIAIMHRRAKLVQRKAWPVIARIANAIFKKQLADVIRRATGTLVRQNSAKGVFIDLMLPEHEGIWARAIEEVFGSADLTVTLEMIPPLRSVMDQAYTQTADLMVLPEKVQARTDFTSELTDVAKKITRINDTTRDKFREVIRRSVDDGLTVSETVQAIQDKLPKIHAGRANTIARTELSNVWSKGSIRAFEQSPTLTHVSVIGCEAREPGSPTYRGESTCNIQDVPVEDAGSLEFHPNHTGTFVPSRFADE